MKTLYQHNQEKMAEYGLDNVIWVGAGVICPRCKKEMLVRQEFMLTSHPPKQQAKCVNPECGEHQKVKYMVV